MNVRSSQGCHKLTLTESELTNISNKIFIQYNCLFRVYAKICPKVSRHNARSQGSALCLVTLGHILAYYTVYTTVYCCYYSEC